MRHYDRIQLTSIPDLLIEENLHDGVKGIPENFERLFVHRNPSSLCQLHIKCCLKDCVGRRAMQSGTANPYGSEAAAKDAMEAVWDAC